jgi:hypothetical protein
MLISEITFPHLQAEREAQLTRELEQRRVMTERLDGESAGEAATAALGRRARRAGRAADRGQHRSRDELTGSDWASTLKA